MRRGFSIFSLAVYFLLSSLSMFGTSIVEFSSNYLEPDKAGQPITIFLYNQGPSPLTVGGFDLALQMGNGVIDSGGVLLKPAITSVELLNGTIFEGFTPAVLPDPGNQLFRQFWSINIPALGGFPDVPAHSRLALATITFDTTELLAGEFSLAMRGTQAGDSIVYDSFGLPLLDNDFEDAVLSVGTPATLAEGANGMTLPVCFTWGVLLTVHRRLRAGS